MNPVSGVGGLLWTGNWQLCQSAVETVLRGGVLRPMMNLPSEPQEAVDHDDASEASRLCLNLSARVTAGGRVKRRSATPEESETSTMESCYDYTASNYFQNLKGGEGTKLLRLFF